MKKEDAGGGGPRRGGPDGALALTSAHHLSTALLLLDARAQILCATRGAWQILEAADGLTGADDVFRVGDPPAARFLRAELALKRTGGTEKAVQVLKVRRESGARPYALVLHAPLTAIEGARLVVQVIDPERHVEPSEEVLRVLFDLTPAEARLARLLGKDLSPREAACELDRSIATVRVQLRSLFRKTGTRRQAELTALLHRAAG
jgi:DNA-binding CsgD family transcriptional regulator